MIYFYYMPLLALMRDYFVWHYSLAYVDIVHIWWNYLWYVNHLFSFPDVVRSWVAPFKRLQEKKVSLIIDPGEFFGNMVVNFIMRMVGFVLRSALIGIAIICFFIVLLLGMAIILLWTILPILVGHFFITGIHSLTF